MMIDFTLPPELEAHDPPEARGTARDGVRLLVSQGTTGEISHHRFGDLPGLLRPGDLIVVNTSGTLPAEVVALPAELRLAVHFSTAWPDGGWLVELRSITGPATVPYPGGEPGDVFVDGGAADAEQPGDGGHGVVRPGQQVACVADLLGGHGRGPAEAHAAGAGGIQSFAGALDDQLADELGQGCEDVENQTSAGRGGVEVLVQRRESDLAGAQLGDHADQVVQGPAVAVEGRDDQGVAGLKKGMTGH